jgi:hypothetical protein
MQVKEAALGQQNQDSADHAAAAARAACCFCCAVYGAIILLQLLLLLHALFGFVLVVEPHEELLGGHVTAEHKRMHM